MAMPSMAITSSRRRPTASWSVCHAGVMASGDEVRARPGWLLEETAFAGRENLDAGHVARYDQKMDAEGEEESLLSGPSG